LSYGDTRRLNPPNHVGGYIAKWSEDFDSLIWLKPINENALETHVFDLQPTPDGQMAFMHYVENHRAWSDSLGTDFHFLIKKMDSEGQIIDEFYHGNFIYASSRGFPHLLAHSNGAYYFSSLDTAGNRSVNRIGFLHKVNPGLDSFEWHLLFPNDSRPLPNPDPYLDPVEYHVEDLYECKNGDILVGGLLFDRFDDFDSLTAEVPFLLRVDSETGEVLWKRVFLTPKDSTDLNTEFTPFRYAWINQIAEDDNRDIYCMGPVLRRNSPEDPRRFDMFLIKINENGCFGEGSCPEDIIMDIDEVITLNPGAYIDPPYPNPVNDYLQIGHIPYERYSLYDHTGNKVQSGRHQSRINMSAMQRGVYFLELIDRKQQAHTFKIIKQ
ncbi:MAG TPA: T9SS type A sorting domain-containing protein, partial [Saprospiraceae bacterium]|nr:T9SS type A sorting domain-containing protein [Saprospiraceae bacterium]